MPNFLCLSPEAIALATELQSDYVFLDDFAARREAMRYRDWDL
jgi:predicted nucleic acid-binding protein